MSHRFGRKSGKFFLIPNDNKNHPCVVCSLIKLKVPVHVMSVVHIKTNRELDSTGVLIVTNDFITYVQHVINN